LLGNNGGYIISSYEIFEYMHGEMEEWEEGRKWKWRKWVEKMIFPCWVTMVVIFLHMKYLRDGGNGSGGNGSGGNGSGGNGSGGNGSGGNERRGGRIDR
jgi:hypothetical protein